MWFGTIAPCQEAGVTNSRTSMNVSNPVAPVGAARPAATLATVRRIPQWPFPVGAGSHQNGSVAATARGVILTTARAYVAEQSSH